MHPSTLMSDCLSLVCNLVQELYSGGTDSNILAWSPPLPCSSEPRATRPGRTTLAARVYQDTWSSDED